MTDETTSEQLVDTSGRDLVRGLVLQVADLIEREEAEPQPKPQPEPVPVQVCEGRWRTRRGEIKYIRPCEPLKGAYFVWPWTDGIMTFQDNGRHQGSQESAHDLVEYLGPIEPQPKPQSESQPEPEKLPEGCRNDGGWSSVNGIEPEPWPEPQPEPQPQAQPVQVREGRWRTRGGQEIPVTAMPTDHDDFSDAYPWWCGDRTWSNNGKYSVYENAMDLVEYLGPIEPEPQPETQPEPVPEPDAELQIRLLKQANDSQAETIGRLLSEARDLNMEIGGLERQLTERQARIRDLETMHAAATQAVVDAGKENDKLRAQAEELRSEVSYVQNLLGESRQRVRQLEELVSSLRTINDAQEKTVRLAGQENTDLQHRLNVVSAELVEQFETVRKLRIELDAAQQVPQAVSDRFEEGWDAGTARAVETIAEWTEPFRRCGSERLAWMVMQNLPHIMRTLTGLAQED